MAQIQSPLTFTPGQVLTAADVNAHVNSATLLAGSITDQTALTVNTVATGDQVVLHDLSATALRKATVSDLLASNIPVTASSVTTSIITGGAGVDLVVTPAAGQKVDVAGAFNVVNAFTVGGVINGTGAVKIATGTTAERPASPIAGHIRFNTTSGTLEVYSGTAWINGVTSGSAVFDGTVNITGAFQLNSKPVYGVYEFDYSGYAYVAFGALGGFTGSKYESIATQTKTDVERWEISFSVAASFFSVYTLTSYTVKIIDSNSVVYATATYPFVTFIDEGNNIADDFLRIIHISTSILPATTFSGVTLAVVVTANNTPTVSRVMNSPVTGHFGSTLMPQSTFSNSVSGTLYTTA